MSNRLLPNRNGYTQGFLNGINEFDAFAHRQLEFQSEGKYRCPYAKCKNKVYLIPDEVKMHLMYKGFMKGYWYWINHGELEPEPYDFGYSTIEMAEASGSRHTMTTMNAT